MHPDGNFCAFHELLGEQVMANAPMFLWLEFWLQPHLSLPLARTCSYAQLAEKVGVPPVAQQLLTPMRCVLKGDNVEMSKGLCVV